MPDYRAHLRDGIKGLRIGYCSGFNRDGEVGPEQTTALDKAAQLLAKEGAEVVAVQIAGLVARRIVCNVKAGDKVSIGDTYGLIRYGSRLDTYLPAGCTVLVTAGQRALAGETVLAELP